MLVLATGIGGMLATAILAVVLAAISTFAFDVPCGTSWYCVMQRPIFYAAGILLFTSPLVGVAIGAFVSGATRDKQAAKRPR